MVPHRRRAEAMRRHWVVDASPIILLAKTGHLDLLPATADTLLIPEAVAEEIRRAPSDDPARAWLEAEGEPFVEPTGPVPVTVVAWDPRARRKPRVVRWHAPRRVDRRRGRRSGAPLWEGAGHSDHRDARPSRGGQTGGRPRGGSSRYPSASTGRTARGRRRGRSRSPHGGRGVSPEGRFPGSSLEDSDALPAARRGVPPRRG